MNKLIYWISVVSKVDFDLIIFANNPVINPFSIK